METGRLRVVAFLALVGLVAGACDTSNATVPAPTAARTVPTARFKLSGDTPPSFLDVPYPTDAYLANGMLVDPLPGVDALMMRNAKFVTHELGRLTGFPQTTFAFFYVDEPDLPLRDDGQPAFADVDPSSLPANEDACVADTSSVFIVDLAATDPSAARIRCRAAIHDDSASSTARPVVAVGPGVGIVLEEGHAYATVLTSRVKTTSGAQVAASADFQALLGGSRDGAFGALYGFALDKVRAALGGALAPDHAQIIALAPYTTNRATREMFALRESLEDMPVPVLKWDTASMAPMGAARFAAQVNGVLPAGFTASLDDWLGVAPKLADGSDDPDYMRTGVAAHDRIAALGTAVFAASNFLLSKPGGYLDLDHATFARDPAGHIVPAPDRPTAPIWVTFAIPRTPMPANGYPCVIVAHGSGGSRADAFMRLANAFAAKGWIVAGVDAVTSGARAAQAKFQVDVHTDWEGSPGATYVGPDGFSDNLDRGEEPSVRGNRNGVLDMLGLGLNFGAVRDQQRQMAIDVSQLVRVLAANPNLAALQTGATTPKIDATRIAYVGGSLGATAGAVAAAIEPKVQLWVLNGAGSQTFTDVGHAPLAQARLAAALLLNFGVTGESVSETNPLAGLIQAAVDAADPLSFASYLVRRPGSIEGIPLRPRNLLMVEAVYDDTVANDGTEALARAAGLGLAMPNVGPNTGVTTMDLVRDPTHVPDRLPLPNIEPDGNRLIHDTPLPGLTAVMVQTSPGRGDRNLLESRSQHFFAVPFNDSTKTPMLQTKQYLVRNSYLEQEAMVMRFLDDGFQGRVPNVVGFKPPVRDVDDDGSPDAIDPDPNDPLVK